MRYIYNVRIILTLSLLILWGNLCFAQQPDFESFRLQYQKQHWKVYQTKAYDLYYVEEADTLVAEVLLEVQGVIKEIEDSLFANQSKKLNIILYSSVAHLQESNIGISADKLLPIGSKRFTGNRVLVAYKGDRKRLRIDLKEKILAQYIQQQIYGEGLKSFLKSVNEKTVPAWFKKSVPSFYAAGWTIEDDLLFKELVLVPKKKTFADLVEQNPNLSGKAFFYYLSQEKRGGAISNFIFSILKGKSVATSAQLVYKEPLWKLQQNALLFYVNRYLSDQRNPFSQANAITSVAVPKQVIKKQTIEFFSGFKEV